MEGGGIRDACQGAVGLLYIINIIIKNPNGKVNLPHCRTEQALRAV